MIPPTEFVQSALAGSPLAGQPLASAAAMTLTASWTERPLLLTLALVLGAIVLVMTTYGVRHVVFTLSRLFGVGDRLWDRPVADV